MKQPRSLMPTRFEYVPAGQHNLLNFTERMNEHRKLERRQQKAMSRRLAEERR